MAKKHLALYGNVSIPREYCDPCGTHSLVLDNVKQCCDQPSIEKPAKAKRMSEPQHKRSRPSVAREREVLRKQENRCRYCERLFGSITDYWGEQKLVKCVWDHQVSYVYASNNADSNFVAACQFCNSWKSSMMFDSVEAVSVYVGVRWAEASSSSSGPPDLKFEFVDGSQK